MIIPHREHELQRIEVGAHQTGGASGGQHVGDAGEGVVLCRADVGGDRIVHGMRDRLGESPEVEPHEGPEEAVPGGVRVRRQRRERPAGGFAHLGQDRQGDGIGQRRARLEVAVEGRDPHAAGLGDGLERYRRAVCGEEATSLTHDHLASSQRIRAHGAPPFAGHRDDVRTPSVSGGTASYTGGNSSTSPSGRQDAA